MPVGVGQDNGLRSVLTSQHLLDLLMDFQFNVLPLLVEAAQAAGHRLAPLGVFGEKQVHSQFDFPHPPGGIDAGRQNKADGTGAQTLRCAPGLGHETFQTWPAGLPQGRQAPGHKRTVLPPKGHHICHRPQAYQVGIFPQNRLLVACQSCSQLKSHPNAREVPVGIAVTLAMGVHHSHCLRQPVFALMVIGDDEIHAQLPAQRRLLHGGNAAVHRHNQGHALTGQEPDRRRVQTVALPHPSGDVGPAVRSPLPEEIREQACGSHTVYIIVPKDCHCLSPLQGKGNSSLGCGHIRHQKRVWQRAVTI